MHAVIRMKLWFVRAALEKIVKASPPPAEPDEVKVHETTTREL